ncbi:Riboflavin transporter MCH5 [Nakaseomyces bracarensis]|uniref:Riboflavin transporter MCH5 n=1 Tax=Nakaseomyces bracarensis TaxID=273131 RepID=A0ABR4NZM0_9SACH
MNKFEEIVLESDVESVKDEVEEEKPFFKTDELEYPEGGVQGWLTVFGAFCGLVACFGVLNASGVVEDHIQLHQLKHVPPSTIGWIFALFLFVTYSTCIFSGTYFDRNGFRDPVIAGAVLHVAGLFATANATQTWHFILSFAIVLGLGNGLMLSPLVAVPAHYFSRKRGNALALATVGGSIGGAIFPIILRKFFALKNDYNPNYGFIWGMRTWSFIDLFLLIITVLVTRERLPHIVDDAKYKDEYWARRIFRVYIVQSIDIKAFRDMKYLFCVLGATLGELSLFATLTYFASYCTAHGIAASDAYILTMVLNLTGVLGRWLPGFLSDMYGRFNLTIIMTLSLSIVMFVGWIPFGTNLTNMYVISALYGFFSASIFSLIPVCCSQISRTDEFGRRYSTMYFVVAFGTLIALPITGAIINDKSYRSYQNYVIFGSVTTFLTALCYIISRFYCVGFRLVKF